MTYEDDDLEHSGFQFYTKEQLLQLSEDINLAQARTNKMMQISRLSNAIKAIIGRLGYEKESQITRAETRGEEFNCGLYDAYLLAKYERDAARKKLAEMPIVPKVAPLYVSFFYEMQQYDPALWKEIRERAAAKVSRINQRFYNAETSEDI